MAVRRAVAMTLACATAVSGLAACGGGGTSTVPKTSQPAPGGPVAGTAWQDVLNQVQPDGTESLATALAAFTLVVGPLPGVATPTGTPGELTDGTIGVRWVVGHWNELNPAQQAAVEQYLVAPAKGQALGAGAAAGVELAGYTASRSRAELASTPSASGYLAQAQAARGVIAADLGRDTPQDLKIVINTTQKVGVTTAAYTDSFDSSWGFTGQAAHCVIYINPFLYTINPKYPYAGTASYVTTAIDHEVFHCFQADDYPSPIAYGNAPPWLVEGQADWVGDTLAPTPDGWWYDYLTKIGTALFARKYDAIGFYAHMAESGVDPWHRFDAMLKAAGNAAAYDIAVNDTFRHDWASSLARQPAFGEGWDTTGPGIIPTAFHPTVSILSDTTVIHATVASYTNSLAEFNATADIVSIDVTNLFARLHASTDYDGSELTNAKFCINVSQCAACPSLASLPRLAAGPMWLAVTGDAAGASYTITGSAASCAPVPCMVGDWVSTNMTVTYASGQQSGGAGHQLHISADGSLTAIYTGMQPIGSLQPTGTATGKVELPADPTADTGPWVVSSVNSTGVTESVKTPYGPRVVPGAHFVADTSSGTWSCKGDNMTVSVPPLTITLARKTP